MEKESMNGKKRMKSSRLTAFCMAAVVLLTLPLALPESYAQEKTCRVLLSKQEGVRYQYEDSHLVPGKEGDSGWYLEYVPGEKAELQILTEGRLERAEFFGEGQELWNVFEKERISFEMPDQDLVLWVTWSPEETTEAVQSAAEGERLQLETAQGFTEEGETGNQKPESELQTDPQIDPEAVTETIPEAETVTEGEQETEAGNTPEAGMETEKETEAGDAAEAETETEKETEAGGAAETETETEKETEAGDAAEAGTETEKETEEESAIETETETDAEQETEAASTAESGEEEAAQITAEPESSGEEETETEGEERTEDLENAQMQNGFYHVEIEDSETCRGFLSRETGEYRAGEMVYLAVVSRGEFQIQAVHARLQPNEAETESAEAAAAETVTAESEGKEIVLTEVSEDEAGEAQDLKTPNFQGDLHFQSGADVGLEQEIQVFLDVSADPSLFPQPEVDEDALFYSFLMPEGEVKISVEQKAEALETPRLLSAASQEPKLEELKLIIGAANIGGQLAWVPDKLKDKDGFSNIKYVQLKFNDNTLKKVFAYCLQPAMPGPPAGSYDAEDLKITKLIDDPADQQKKTSAQRQGVSSSAKSAKMAKAMYYLYRGPAWGRDVSDGTKTYNFREMMKNAGCVDAASGKGFDIYDDYYFVTHMVLSYIYLGPGGKWNYATDAAANAVGPALNSKGIRLVETISAAIDRLPSSATYFSEEQLAAAYDPVSGKLKTPEIIYTANEDNEAKITLPKGIALVNTATGQSFTGSVAIPGGTKFYLQAEPSVAGSKTYTFKTAFATEFSAYKISFTNKQDIGFAYEAGNKSLAITVEWPSEKIIEIQKRDQDTGAFLPQTGMSFLGAEYTVYKEAACKNKVTVIVTDEKGYGRSRRLPIGDYYVKETRAPKGYLLDETIYPILMDSQDGVAAYRVESKEEPERKQIEIQKYDKETGLPSPADSSMSFKGAEYTIYEDAGCEKTVETVALNSQGYGKSGKLLLKDYYVRETKAPAGYLLDETVHFISMKSGDQVPVYRVESKEEPERKSIEIQKYDRESGAPKPGNSSVSFAGAEYTIYEDAGCEKTVETVVLNSQGYGKSGKLLLKDYYVRETKAPAGYLLDEMVHFISMKSGDPVPVCRVEAKEQIIRGSLALVKYLDDNADESVLQDWYDSGKLAGIRFWLRHEDPAVAEVSIVTDRYGYASTEKKELVCGIWHLTEDPATTPEGYQGIRDVKIEIKEDEEEKLYVVTNKPYEAYLCIQKQDKDTQKQITRGKAEFQILDPEGRPVQMPTFDGYQDIFTTNEKGEIHLPRSLKGGSYSLVEVKAPEGYELADPIPFTVKQNAVFQEPLTVVCQDTPKKGRIQVQKKDRNTKENCGEGFVFEITAAEDILDGSGAIRIDHAEGKEIQLKAGTVVDRITTDRNGNSVSRALYLGTYLVKEVAAQDYYAVNPKEFLVKLQEKPLDHEKKAEGTSNGRSKITEEGSSEREEILEKVEVENEKTRIEIEKVDARTDRPMAGVTFRLWEKKDSRKGGTGTDFIKKTEAKAAQKHEIEREGKEQEDTEVREIITDSRGVGIFENLKKNTVYCLQEIRTLEGYVTDPMVYEIEVQADGRIEGEPVYRVKIANEPNVAEISKQDITGGKELPGACLMLQNQMGKVICQWISGEEPYQIYGLPAGTYTLTEITAPDGYEKAESITFTLSDSFQVEQIVMYDAPAEPETEVSTEPVTEPETEASTELVTEPETEALTEPVEETEKQTETSPEPETQLETKKETEPVIIPGGGSSPGTGDATPVFGVLFLAICSLALAAEEILRRMKL